MPGRRSDGGVVREQLDEPGASGRRRRRSARVCRCGHPARTRKAPVGVPDVEVIAGPRRAGLWAHTASANRSPPSVLTNVSTTPLPPLNDLALSPHRRSNQQPPVARSTTRRLGRAGRNCHASNAWSQSRLLRRVPANAEAKQVPQAHDPNQGRPRNDGKMAEPAASHDLGRSFRVDMGPHGLRVACHPAGHR
jgi:hypothetical protein